MSKATVSPESESTTSEGHATRRAALGVLVGVGALGIPAIGSIASTLGDPVFAAIARHNAAFEARKAARFAIDDQINNPEGCEVSEAKWDAFQRAHENENAAFDALLTAAPETSLGMRAITAHLIRIDDGRLSLEMRRLLALLRDSPLLAG